MQEMQVKLVFILILTSQDNTVMYVDRVTTDVKTSNLMRASSCPCIPDTNCAIPSSRYDYVWIIGHVFGTDDPILLTWET